MKKIVFAVAAAGAMTLAACGPQDAAEDVQEQQLESQEDVLEEQADLQDEMGNEAAADDLDAQADMMGESADEVDGANVIEEDTTMTDDGTMTAVETITADFPSGRHGLFRYWDVARVPYIDELSGIS